MLLIGQPANKPFTIKPGNCNLRASTPMLVDFVRMGRIKLPQMLTRIAMLEEAIEVCNHFDKRK